MGGIKHGIPYKMNRRSRLEAVFRNLEPLKRAELVTEWLRCRPENAFYKDDQIISRNVLLVIEIVERARSGARRTVTR